MGGNIYCVLCKKYLQNSNEDWQIKQQMESHLTSQAHEYIIYEGDDNYKTSAELHCSSVKDKLTKLFKNKMPHFLENSIDYIDMYYDNDYYCHLCDKYLQVSQDYDITVHNFKKHLLSAGHKYKLNKYVLQIPQTALERYFSWIHNLLEINYNKVCIPNDVSRCIDYFGGDAFDWFYCCLCDEYMEIIETRKTVMRVKNLKSHLNSRKHKKMLCCI